MSEESKEVQKETQEETKETTNKRKRRSSSTSKSSTNNKDNKQDDKQFELVNNTREVITLLNKVDGSHEQVNIAPHSSKKLKEVEFNGYVSNLVNNGELSINKN